MSIEWFNATGPHPDPHIPCENCPYEDLCAAHGCAEDAHWKRGVKDAFEALEHMIDGYYLGGPAGPGGVWEGNVVEFVKESMEQGDG